MHIHTIVVGGIATNCWVYPLPAKPGTCAIIDPGEEGERIIGFLNQLNLSPEYILLTHGHFDHIGAVPVLASRFINCEVAIHGADAEYLGTQAYHCHSRSFTIAAGNTAYLDMLWEEMPAPGRILAEGDQVGPFTVLHIPGHTPGSIALLDTEAGVLFSGDTLFRNGYGRTDLPGGSEELMHASLKRLFSLDPDIRVYPGHGPSSTIGEESS